MGSEPLASYLKESFGIMSSFGDGIVRKYLTSGAFAVIDGNNHVVSYLIDNSVVAAIHLRHRSCSDKSS